MPFKIVRNDITKMQVDVIVNTENKEPIYSTGTDSAVYMAAGEKELLAERKKIGRMVEGEVAVTPGFYLPAKYIIHTVSPCYINGISGEEEKLRGCYTKSLHLAYSNHCMSIAFPLISTGNLGYPKEEAMRIAVDEINAFLLNHEMMVYLVVFDEKSTALGLKLYPALEAYIDQNYVHTKREEEYSERHIQNASRGTTNYSVCTQHTEPREKTLKPQSQANVGMWDSSTLSPRALCPQKHMDEWADDEYSCFLEENETALNERMQHLADTFQEYLFYLLESKGLNNAEVYKKAIITKQLFSKIKLNPLYHPDKATAMRLCVGAKLSLDETIDLLARAGYALSPCDKRDIIFSFFIENKVYDMIEIDIALEEHGLPCFIE